MRTSEIAQSLNEWTATTGLSLPLPIVDTCHVELCGGIVDLESGDRYFQRESWLDFAQRHIWIVISKGEQPTVERLAQAVHKANEHNWSKKVCFAIATTTLAEALRTICTVMPKIKAQG